MAAGWKLFQGQKPNPTFMIQNCDLPPPVNVVKGLSDTNRTSGNFNLMMMDQEEEKLHSEPRLGLMDDNKLELLKALRLSQTRAREAEKRSRELVQEKNSLSNAIIHQSMELIAYRNFVTLLELQISVFKSKLQIQPGKGQQSCLCSCSCSCSYCRETDIPKGSRTSSEEPESMSWVFALAIPIGIAAGLGITFACRYLF